MDPLDPSELKNERDAQILAQIALLKYKLSADAQKQFETQPAPEERSREGRERSKSMSKVLVGASPVKEKKIRTDLPSRAGAPISTSSPSRSARPPIPSASSSQKKLSQAPSAPRPSKLLASEAALRRSSTPTSEPQPKQRSTSLASRTADTPAVERDDDLRVVEKLELGPREFPSPDGDPKWEKREPNSGIVLKSRELPHDDLQDYLISRYHIPPSLLYSVARLNADKTSYDVPVTGDWVTIGVVGERSDIRVSRGGGRGAAQQADSDDSDAEGSGAGGRPRDKGKKAASAAAASSSKSSSSKYIVFKLIDFGPSAPKGSGANTLNLILFEAKSASTGSGGVEKTYRGGSGGAYEKFWKLKEGSVVALLNPRILKPMSGMSKGDYKNPNDSILALSPESADSMTVIGVARDYGTCQAVRKDGQRCTSWVNRKQSQVCEFHIQQAVTRNRAGRAEFASSTSGMQSHSGPALAKNRVTRGFDLSATSGLLPRNAATNNSDGSTTYVVSGVTVRSGDWDGTSAAERYGRDKEDRLKRKRDRQQGEQEMQEGLGRGKVRKVSMVPAKKKEDPPEPPKKSIFTADKIRKLGFDPTGLSRSFVMADDAASRAALIDSLKRKTPLPGGSNAPSVRGKKSNVIVPAWAKAADEEERLEGVRRELELRPGKEETVEEGERMVDLDSSSDEE